MIAENVIRELQELDNIDLERAVAMFIHAAHAIAIENDPRHAPDEASHRTGKPGSRGPGRERCKSAVNKLVRLAHDADNAWANITPAPEHGIESMGGISVTVQDGKLVGRRKDGAFSDGNVGRPGARPRFTVCQEVSPATSCTG